MSDKIKAFLHRLLTVDDHTAEYEYEDIKGHRFAAALAALPFLFWLPLARHDRARFVLFHANNGAVLLAASGAAMALSFILRLLPFGWLFSFINWAFLAVLAVFSSLDALSGGARELLILGKLKLKLVKFPDTDK